MLLLSLEVIALSLARYYVACITTVRFVVKLEEQLKREIRGVGYAFNTEKAYLQNYRKFVQFTKNK